MRDEADGNGTPVRSPETTVSRSRSNTDRAARRMSRMDSLDVEAMRIHGMSIRRQQVSASSHSPSVDSSVVKFQQMRTYT